MRAYRSVGEIKIRRGMEDDAKALRELLDSLKDEDEIWRSLIGKEEEWIHSKIKDDRVHNTQNPGKWLFFAFDGEKLVGHVNGMAWDRAPNEYKQHVEDMKTEYNLIDERVGHLGIAVHKDYRQRGIGEMLMRIAIQEAKQLGVTVLTSNINAENILMMRLAEKLSFKEHMRLKKGDKIGKHTITKESIIMKLRIQEVK